MKQASTPMSKNKTKAMIQNRKTKRSEIQTINDHGTDMIRSFKYVPTVINNTNDETKEIKAGIIAANKAYYSMQNTFTYTQIQRNNKIRL